MIHIHNNARLLIPVFQVVIRTLIDPNLVQLKLRYISAIDVCKFNQLYSSAFTNMFTLGDFEIFITSASTLLLGLIIYNVINCFTFRDILKRFGFTKTSRRDFYECGFKPVSQKPIRLPIQFLLICVFFLLYDIELIFLFPYVSGVTFGGLYENLILVLFFGCFLISLVFDFNRHALLWQY